MSRPGASSPGAGPVVDGYLEEIAARLPGSRRGHAGIVAELRAGLLDAVDAHRFAGLSPAEAVQTAVREFGDPALVADAFRAEIAATQARRVAVALLATGPLVGLLWIATALTSDLHTVWQWSSMPAGLRVGVQLVAVSAGVTAWAAVLSIAATGRLTRRLRDRPRRAPTAAAVAAFGAVGADGIGLVLLAAQLAAGTGELAVLPATAAAVASVTRLVLARRAAVQCLATRTSLT